MNSPSPDTSARPQLAVGFREFVALVAAIMSVNALGIDSMLPALPAIGDAIGIVEANQRQWIISAYLIGFGVAQLVYGPLADRYGRKPVLFIGLGTFVVTSLIAALATNFETMVAARALQGIGAAASRVLVVSIVRDCYSGRQMARVMSLSFIVFLAVPILAPTIGLAILQVAPWEGIFVFLAVFSALVILWAGIRLPETLHPEYRQKISAANLTTAARVVLTNRYSLGYTLATTLLLGSLFGFINSVQQIFEDVFHAPEIFPLIFALVAMMMAVASFLNSRIVERLGTRLVSHVATIGFILFAGLHLALAMAGHESLVTFTLCQSMMMGCFGLAASNFGSMSMEPLGEVAGTASSIQGFISSVGGALIGAAVGQAYDGTIVPVVAGFVVLGLATLVMIFVTEKGRLFQPHQEGAL